MPDMTRFYRDRRQAGVPWDTACRAAVRNFDAPGGD